MQQLLAESDGTRRDLLSLGIWMADSMGEVARAIELSEQLVDISLSDLADTIDVQQVRSLFGGLLRRYDHGVGLAGYR